MIEAACLRLGLDIPEALHDRKMGELQGGQKVRVLLAQALFGNPDVLLLEPDAPAIAELFKQCRDRIAAEDHSVNAVQAAIRIPAQRPLSEPSERRVAKESLAS